MKYTAEDLYQWILEEKYVQDLMSASVYNNRNFLAAEVEGEIAEKEDGFYVTVKLPGSEAEEMRFASLDQADQIHFFMEEKENVKMTIICHEDKYNILFAYGETEEQRSINYNHNVIVSMLDALKIDTKGKVKKLILEAGDVLGAAMLKHELKDM